MTETTQAVTWLSTDGMLKSHAVKRPFNGGLIFHCRAISYDRTYEESHRPRCQKCLSVLAKS